MDGLVHMLSGTKTGRGRYSDDRERALHSRCAALLCSSPARGLTAATQLAATRWSPYCWSVTPFCCSPAQMLTAASWLQWH
eukprot:1141859-Pelagomonas_calceolata.AAC.5